MSQSSLSTQAAMSTAGVLAQGLARFGYTVLIGRVLGASELGSVSAWLSLSLLLSLLWPTAAGNAASRYLALPGAGQATLRFLFRTFWVSAAALAVIAVPIAIVGYRAPATTWFEVVALVVAYSGYIFSRGALVGLGRIAAAALWDVISAATTIALLAITLLVHASDALLLPITIGYGVFLLYSALSSHLPQKPGESVDRPSISRAVAWNSVGIIASNGLIQLSMLFVYGFDSQHRAGLYAAAMSLATPASMLAQSVSQVLIPRFAAHAHDEPLAAHRSFLRTFAAFSGVLLVVFGVVLLLAPWVVRLVYGASYSGAAAMMQLLLLGVLAFSVGLLANAYLLAIGRVATTTVFALIGLVVGLGVMVTTQCLVGVAFAAASGVAVGYVIATGGMALASLRRPCGAVTPGGHPA